MNARLFRYKFTYIFFGLSLTLNQCDKPSPPPGSSSPTPASPPSNTPNTPRDSSVSGARPTPPPPTPPVPPVVTPAVTDGSTATNSPLRIHRFEFAQAVENRSPVGSGTSFTTAIPKVYSYFEVENTGTEPNMIIVSYIRPSGRPLGNPLQLQIPAVRRPWRTWANAQIHGLVGTWTMVVTDGNNTELQRSTFEVTQAPAVVPTTD